MVDGTIRTRGGQKGRRERERHRALFKFTRRGGGVTGNLRDNVGDERGKERRRRGETHPV